jgi:ATP-dependent DNA helicase RecG
MPETQNIEYKSTWRDEFLREICGFANAQGGTLFIGKDDNGNIVGVKNTKKLLEDLPNKITTILGIVADVNLYETEQGDYLEIVVDSQPNPVNYKGEYHYRSGSTKQELKGAALDKFLLQKYGRKWDSVPIPKITVNDLSLTALQRFRKEAVRKNRVDVAVLNDSTDALMQNLHLFDEETGCLKRAAILLFYPEPERFFTGAYIKIGFFRGSDADLAFQDEIHGPIMEQIDKTIDLLTTKYITYAITYEGVSRRETPTFPEVALRESLLNALAHKDYSSGVPVQISVYPDRIVFWNAGELPTQIPVERLLQKHPSLPYNPDIANTLFRSGDIEAWGRGYEKIVESVLAHKQLPPKIEHVNGLMLTYYTNFRTQMLLSGMDEKEISIIEYVIINGSITNKNVQELLKVSKATATRLLSNCNPYLEMRGMTKGSVYYISGSK